MTDKKTQSPDVKQLVARLFERRNEAHAQHWKTKSFSQHEALGDYYTDIISALDNYVEAHQGALGLVKDIAHGDEGVVQSIEEDLIWITKYREDIAEKVPALENLLDELCAVHMRALYKLKNLR